MGMDCPFPREASLYNVSVLPFCFLRDLIKDTDIHNNSTATASFPVPSGLPPAPLQEPPALYPCVRKASDALP